MGFLEKLRALKAKKVMGAARVCAYLMCVSALVALWAGHEAKAAMGEQAFVLGRDLAKVADLLDHTYELHINGQTAYIARNEAALPLVEILDRYETLCREHPGILADAWHALPPGAQTMEGKGDLSGLVARFGVLRKQGKNEGVVACLVRGANDPELPATERFERFLKTGDLTYVGRLRYVYVGGPSPSGRHTVTTIWTEDNFNIDRIIPPEEGDAPGTDSPTAGRPPSARRIFSAGITGAPYGIRIYESKAPPEIAYAKFDATLTTDGWDLFRFDDGAHVYVKDGVETMVQAVRDPNGKTVVTISELGGEQLRTTR